VSSRHFARGKALEAELRAYHTRLATLDGAPRVGRLHAAATLGKADSDFAGHINGRRVVVEAKEVTSSARFRLDAIEPHQVAALRECHRGGGIAVLVVRVEGITWALGYPALEGAIVRAIVGAGAPGTASLAVADLDRVGARLQGVAWWGVELPGWSERQGRLL
jgi:Recombination protein U